MTLLITCDYICGELRFLNDYRIGIKLRKMGSNINKRETLVNLWLRMIINILLLHDVIIGKDAICIYSSSHGQVKVKGNRVLRRHVITLTLL